MRCWLNILLCSFLTLPLCAQGLSYGVQATVNDNIHSATFSQLPGIPSCCPRYENGSAVRLSFGVLSYYDLASGFSLRTDLVYRQLGADLTRNETQPIFSEGELKNGVFEHRVSASLNAIALDPLLDYQPIRGLHLFGGLSFMGMISKSYHQQEKIIEPEIAGSFVDDSLRDTHSRIRNDYSGDIPGAKSFMIGLQAGLSFDLKAAPKARFQLCPQVVLMNVLTPVSREVPWTVNSIRVGVALRYNPPTETQTPRIERSIDTIPTERPGARRDTVLIGMEIRQDESRDEINQIRIVRHDTLVHFIAPKSYALSTSLSLYGLQADSSTRIERIRLEEFQSLLMTPLLNYVFFEPTTSQLAPRYHRLQQSELENFSPEVVNDIRKLPTYYHVLNIVAKRMQRFPSAHIELVGCTDDSPAERNSPGLALRRAQAVQTYLLQTWHLDSSRISVRTRALPQQASNTNTEDGAAENRRVEIHADNDEILAPIVSSDTIREWSPKLVLVESTTHSDTSLTNCQLQSLNHPRPIHQFSSCIAGSLSQRFSVDTLLDIKHDTSLAFRYSVRNAQGAVAETSARLPLELMTIVRKQRERRGDYEIDRFSLILFQVRSFAIEGVNRTILGFIRNRLSSDSKLSISGYTDRLGDEEYNAELSRNRAQNVERELLSDKTKKVEVVQSIGRGETNLYDNDLPEGRFYSRTVDVVVQTPIHH